MLCQEIFVFILSIFFIINAIKSDSSGPNILKPLPSEDSSNIVASYRKDPSLQSNESIVVIDRVSSAYCQIYLNFDYFHLGEVDQQGYCIGGLTVSGHNNSNNVPKICGENRGHHIYINFNEDDSVYLNFVEASRSDDWYLWIYQISCLDLEYRAPTDCLQYHTSSTSSVMSFNYQDITSIADPPITYQISNQSYYICIGREGEYSAIEWTRGSETTNYYFGVSSDIETTEPGAIGTITAASFDSECTGTNSSNDYIEIPNGKYADASGENVGSELFCGNGFPQYVYSNVSPFRIHVVTSAEEGTREGSVGFYLEYRTFSIE